jgi:hypothetical protein
MRRPPGGPVRKDRSERGARGRARTPHAGGSGSPSAPTKRGCLQWLDAVGLKAGQSRPDKRRFRRRPPPGSTAPETEIAAKWSAGWRTRFRKARPAQKADLKLKRHSALHPLAFAKRGKRRGLTPSRPNNRGNDVRLRSRCCASGSLHQFPCETHDYALHLCNVFGYIRPLSGRGEAPQQAAILDVPGAGRGVPCLPKKIEVFSP